jgi:hypothetical protein
MARKTEPFRQPNCCLPTNVALVHLPATRELFNIVHRLTGRKKNIEAARPTREDTRLKAVDNGRYSSRCTYTHWTYRPLIRNFVTLGAGGMTVTLRSDLLSKDVRVDSPAGYRFDIDAEGMLVLIRRRCGTEFHPTTDDLIGGKGHLRAKVLETVQRRAADRRRQREAQQDAKRLAEAMHLTCVTYEDSRRAGNCAAGTRSFMGKLGLGDRSRNVAVGAKRLKRLADRSKSISKFEKDRLDAAIRAADERLTMVCI